MVFVLQATLINNCKTIGILRAGADPARKFRGGAISVIFGSQVSFQIVKNHGEKSYFRRF